MNHIYRIVWNALTATWVAVAENARSQGKGSKRSARKAGRQALTWASLATIGLAVTAAMAQTVPTTVVPVGGNTAAYTAVNGVPVVDINTVNAAGLSHNKFTNYNVDARGLVLNNGNMDQFSRLSQLAGRVPGNANLTQQARVILNEVVSTNRSVLAGFTEVLGGKADVVVANPNGITCSGCGFINTDRITLTTGTPTFGADGGLGGFNVNRGDVLINGAGANATTQQIFDLVARSVKIDGKINTSESGSLGITTGTNSWSYNGRNATGAVAPSGAVASYAIDSTALGGMYSGRINIIATEAGVGVRMLGEAAASADDFKLTSAGKIELQATLSAKQDMAVTTTAASGNADLLVAGAGKLSAARDLALSATSGQVKLLEGELHAANNLTTTTASLSDASVAAKTRFAAGNNTLSVTGAANINGSVWGAGGALAGNAGSLAVGTNSATLYAGSTLALSTTNNLALGTAVVSSAGNMTLAADAGNISTTAGATQGIQTTAGNLSISAGGGLTNAGKMTADMSSVTARINGTLANSGTLQAKTTLDLADKTGGSAGNIDNSGILLADGSLTISAASVSNQAGATLQGSIGTALLATSLNNAGTLIASNTAGQAIAFSLGSLTNSGTLQSAGNLDLNLTNALANTGQILAANNLAVNAGASNLALSNTGAAAVLQAGNALTVTGANATFNTQSGTVLGNAVDLTISRLNNSGTLQSNNAMTLAVGGALTNSGTLLAKGGLTSSSATLTNSGMLTASDVANIKSVITANTITNSGALQSAGNQDLNLTTALANTGKILATKNLAVNAGTSAVAMTNTGAAAVLQAGNALTVNGSNATFNTQQGTVLGNTVGLTVASLNSSGTLQSNDAMTLAVGGALTNSGTLLAKGGLTSSSASLTNSGSLIASDAAGINTSITASTLNNSGTLQSKGNAALNLTTALANTGRVLADNNLAVNAGTSALAISNAGAVAVLQAGNALTVNGTNATFNTQSGTVLGNTVGLTVASLDTSGTLQSNDTMTLAVGGTFTNSGILLAKGGLTSGSATLTNSGTLTASDVAGIDSIITANTITNSGTLQSKGNATLNLATALANTGKVLAANNLAVNAGASAFTISNTGASAVLQAGNAFAVNGSNVTFGTQSGTVLGNTVALTLTSGLNNSGTLQSNDAMTVAVAGALTNSGTLLAKGGLTSTSDTLSNSGTLTLADNTGTNGTINSKSLTNSGTLQSNGNVTLNLTNALTNTGKVLASNNLAVNTGTAAFTISNTGAAAVLQAGNALAVNGSSVTFGTQSGTVLGNTVALALASGLNNSGTLQSNDVMTLAVAGALTNSGTLLAKGGLTSNAATVNNSGALTAADNAGANGSMTTGSLTNSGTLQSAGNLDLNLTTALANTGKVLAANNLAVNAGTSALAISNTGAAALLQAGNALTVDGNNATFNTQQGTVLGNTVSVKVASLNNSGTMQSNNAMTLAVGGALTNSGTLLAKGGLTSDSATLTNSGTLTASNVAGINSIIKANTITNSGTLQSKGNVALNIAYDLDNTGTVLTNGSLTARGFGNFYRVNNSGRIQADGLLDIKGISGGKAVDVTANSGSVLLGGSLDIKADTLTVQDNAMVSSAGDMKLSLDTLAFGGSRSSIVAATSGTGDANITVTSGFNNVGAVHSGGNMTFSAPSIGNTGTGAFSALKTLSVSATAGNLDNYGALYAGQTLNANAKFTVTNHAGATIDSDGDINIDTPAVYTNSNTSTFTNNSTVNAAGNINIAAAYFNNNIQANNARAWSGFIFNNYNASRKITTEDSSPTSGWNSGAEAGTYCRAAGASASAAFCGVSEDIASNEWSRSQYFTGGSPTNSVKPQIIGGGTTTVSNFQTANNLGGVISGRSVMLASNRSNATFTNDDLRLATYSGTQSVSEYGYWAGVAYTPGTLRYEYGGTSRLVYANGTSTIDGVNGLTVTNVNFSNGVGAGVFANGGNLAVTGTVNLINIGGTAVDGSKTASPTSTTASGAAANGLASATGTNAASLTGTAGAAATGKAATAGAAATANTGTSGVAATSGVNAAGVAAAAAAGATGVTATNGLPGVAFAGLVINLPSNPNGFFVISVNPSARYLVETNPRFLSGQSSLGSDYLFQRYGINPDAALKRLGDANYEAYLVRQQLITQTGNNILSGYGKEADQMKRLMDQAADQGKAAGFEFGKALTPDQIANLKTDVVWMVETTVSGQRVLAPVVYLATATRLALVTGAVIAGTSVSMNVASLSNTGGTIVGEKSLQVVSAGNITNTAGTITGGDVSLQSTGGSIDNITTVQGSNIVSKTGTISATGDLKLDAKTDINIIGSAVKAGGDAKLVAGGNITLDTIVTTDFSNSSTSTSGNGQRSSSTSNTVTTTNVGSTLATGGKLSFTSGGNTTIAGSKVDAGTGMVVDAVGDFNILARQDTITTRTETSASGRGVGGGLFGSQTSETNSFKGTNVGSSINVGGSAAGGPPGDLVVKAGGAMTLQGSNLNVAGNANIKATGDIKILDGLDESRSTTTTKTTTFLTASNGGSSSAGTNASAEAAGKTAAGASVDGSAGAKAGANSDASGTANVTLFETNKTVTTTESRKSVASNFTVGGNLNAKSDGNVVIQGSNLAVGGNADLKGRTVQVLAGENIERTTTTSTTVSVGKIETGGQAAAGANTAANASGDGSNNNAVGVFGKASANATGDVGAQATANASGNVNIKLGEVSTTKSESGSNKSAASGITVGGNLLATADKVTIRGSNLAAGGDLDIKAKNVEVLAGQNTEFSKSTTVTGSVGLYVTGSAQAQAGANAAGSAGTGNAEKDSRTTADASAGAGVKASATQESVMGVRGEVNTDSSKSLTNTASNLTSGRNMSVTATETARFVGAKLAAGGDLAVDAKNIVNLAAQDTTSSTSSRSEGTAGAYAQRDAKVDASAKVGQSSLGASASASLDLSSGVVVRGSNTLTSEGSTTQQVSSFTAGGNVRRTAQEGIIDQGTKITAGGNIDQKATTVTEIDARDSKFSTSTTIAVEQKRGVGGTLGGEVSTSGGAAGTMSAGVRGVANTSGGTAFDVSTKAVTGSYTAGGDINSATTGKTTLIGTQITSGGNTQLNAGKLDFKAAQDTTNKASNATKVDIAAKVELDISLRPSGALDIEASNKGSTEKSSTAVAGSINSGGRLNINVGGDANLEGTKIQSGGSVAIAAGGTVNMVAARDTKQTSDYGVEAKVGFSTSKAGMGIQAELNVSGGGSKSSIAQAGGITAGAGGINVTAGKDVKLEGTALQTTGNAALLAGGKVELKAAESKTSGGSGDLTLGFSASKEKKAPGAAGATPTAVGNKPVAAGTKPVAAGTKPADGAAVGETETTKSVKLGGKLAVNNKVESQAVVINSGAGSVTVKGAEVVNQQAEINTTGSSVMAGKVTNLATKNSDVAVNLAGSISKESKPKPAAKPAAGTAASTAPGTAAPLAVPTKPAKPAANATASTSPGKPVVVKPVATKTDSASGKPIPKPASSAVPVAAINSANTPKDNNPP